LKNIVAIVGPANDRPDESSDFQLAPEQQLQIFFLPVHNLVLHRLIRDRIPDSDRKMGMGNRNSLENPVEFRLQPAEWAVDHQKATVGRCESGRRMQICDRPDKSAG
jgi:hypothetical protein